MLQCVAVCCNKGLLDAIEKRSLECAAVCCSVLQCVALSCSVLQCVVVCCSVLQCVAVCCSVVQCAAVCCSVLQCVAVCCRILQCVAVFCSNGLLDAIEKRSFECMCFSMASKRLLLRLAGMCVAVCCSVLQCVAVCVLFNGIEKTLTARWASKRKGGRATQQDSEIDRQTDGRTQKETERE